MGNKVKRLYQQFQPEHYNLELEPDSETMKFRGNVIINGSKVGRPSNRITFHQKGLKIVGATVLKKEKRGDTKFKVLRINNHNNYDEVRIHTEENVYPGKYEISLEFEGNITKQMNGIYPCYFNQDGKDEVLIATQFESHHAREAFPCIDEPEAKATFQLSLTTDKDEVVLSNTPIKSEKNISGNKNKSTTFEITPRMSTYLLAFVFGNIKYTEATTRDGVLVRAYATPDKVKYTDFALEVAVKALEFYNEYFDIPYPLAKCDLIALPDFASGAMENWGLITFREQALIVDPANTSLHLKQYVANVVAHELTHQWFGNLVTMRWWTDLWLNESFASWMSYLAVDKLFPDWKVWTQFIVDEQGLAFKQDSLEHTHPIEVTVNHPDEIRTIFDAISYEKGASVLLMLHDYLGDTAFRDGLRLYLKRHAFDNTDTIDLWDSLEEVSKRPVKEFMGIWTSQSGFPIVKANLSTSNPVLEQDRFYLNPKANKVKSKWPIPLLPTENFLNLLENDEQKVDFKPSKKLMLNHNRTSFFLTIYDSSHLKNLSELIDNLEINELDRLGLLSDSFEASKAGYSKTVDSLKLLEHYKNEDSSVVWDIIAGNIGSLRLVMDDDDVREGLKPLVADIAQKQLLRLGWDEKPSDSHFDRLLRPTILGLSSFAEISEVVDEIKSRFQKMKEPEDVHPDLRGVLYGTMARIGGEEEFAKLVKMHNHSTNSEERVTIAGALTGFSQTELINKALAMVSSDKVRLQDAPYWIAYSFMNRHAKHITWQWLNDNWEWLLKNLGTDLSFFRMPVYAGRAFSDEKFIPEFSEFFQSRMSPAFERPVNQAIETIQWQSSWKSRDLDSIRKYLSN